jgi:hypothetical protein
MLIVAGVIVSILLTVAVGWAIGFFVSSSGEIRPPGEISDDPSTCQHFCNIWQSARVDVCFAKTSLTAAADFNTSCQKAYWAAVALAALLAGLAAAAALVPLVGQALAEPLWTAAAIATAAVATLFAIMVGAGLAAVQRNNELMDANDAVTKASVDVSKHCTLAEQATCFAMPAPC